jgi:diacylglycerol kinase family enzyme
VEQHPIADLDTLPPQGEIWQARGIDLVIAAGGDGVIGGVITHIAQSGLPLGILPLGTSNDIARSLNIPLELELAARTISDGKAQEVDVGVAKPAEQTPHRASKGSHAPVRERVSQVTHGYFAHVLTAGLNVQFARIATNVATRKRYGRLTYPIAALETLKYHKALDVALHLEGLAFPPGTENEAHDAPELGSLSFRALQVTIINAPIFGGQWKISVPNASIKDRLLDIVVIEEIELSKLNETLAHFFTSFRQDHPSNGNRHPAELSGIPAIHHFQAQGALIITDNDPRDVTLDGEVRGQTPIYAHIAEKRLRVIVPEDAQPA